MTSSLPSRYVRTVQGVAGYSPANHTGTSNQRLISHETVGAKYMELLIGTIVKGHGATRHYHPHLEQAGYMFQGGGLGEINGVEREVGPGGWRFYPKVTPHRLTVTSDEPVKTIVLYAPPYAENKQATVVCDDLTSMPAKASTGVEKNDATTPTPIPGAEQLQGAQWDPLVTADTSGAENMAIYGLQLTVGGGAASHRLNKMEQALFLRKGTLTGRVNGEPFEATEGDFVFIPEGALHDYACTSNTGANLFVIRAFPTTTED